MALVGRALGLPTEKQSGEAPIARNDSTAWSALITAADIHRVLPLLHSGLKASPEMAVPMEVSERIEREAHRLWRRSLILSQELVRISRLLSESGISMAAMKGPGLSAQAYGSGVARAMRDLDILIRPKDFPQARKVLEAGGFVCETPVSGLSPALQDLYLDRATHVSFQHDTLGYLLEVHLRPMQVPSLLAVPTEVLLAEACPVSLGSGEVPVLSPRHHFLYVAAHGAKHGWWRLLWLADFAALQQRRGEPSLLDSGVCSSKDHGLQRVLSASAHLCHAAFGTPLPQPVPGASERGVRLLTRHGRRCLQRGRPPVSYREKWDELFNLLQLRTEAAYRLDVGRLYWDLTPSDLACFPAISLPPPGVLRGITPALRPFLWALRRVPYVQFTGCRESPEEPGVPS